ncbi:Uncharacterised protein [Porphyromonas cangingivalis]|nr:Uncharacterised protein [Porphyromonas cangingivalis]
MREINGVNKVLRLDTTNLTTFIVKSYDLIYLLLQLFFGLSCILTKYCHNFDLS